MPQPVDPRPQVDACAFSDTPAMGPKDPATLGYPGASPRAFQTSVSAYLRTLPLDAGDLRYAKIRNAHTPFIRGAPHELLRESFDVVFRAGRYRPVNRQRALGGREIAIGAASAVTPAREKGFVFRPNPFPPRSTWLRMRRSYRRVGGTRAARFGFRSVCDREDHGKDAAEPNEHRPPCCHVRPANGTGVQRRTREGA
jgi:hypothetical protein